MPSDTTARRLYDQAIVIDGLNVSSWDSPAVFRSLHAGGVTAHQRDDCDLGELPRDDGHHRRLATALWRRQKRTIR